MLGYSFIKTLCAVGVIAFFGASAATAQRTITLDNEACVRGLEALASLTDVEIKPDSTPRKFGNTCRALGVRISSASGGFVARLEKMEWGTSGFGAVASGRMPPSIRMSIKGARVTSASPDQPLWGYLAGTTNGVQSMDAVLEINYLPASNQLVLRRVEIDFQNGNTITLTAGFSGVSPKLPSNPLLGAASFFLDDLTLRITSGVGAPNPALAIILALLRDDMPDATLEDVKKNAAGFLTREFGAILGANDQRDLTRLITDLPRASGPVLLAMKSAKGFALVRLALLTPDTGLAGVFDGVEISFEYGARAN